MGDGLENNHASLNDCRPELRCVDEFRIVQLFLRHEETVVSREVHLVVGVNVFIPGLLIGGSEIRALNSSPIISPTLHYSLPSDLSTWRALSTAI